MLASPEATPCCPRQKKIKKRKQKKNLPIHPAHSLKTILFLLLSFFLPILPTHSFNNICFSLLSFSSHSPHPNCFTPYNPTSPPYNPINPHTSSPLLLSRGQHQTQHYDTINTLIQRFLEL